MPLRYWIVLLLTTVGCRTAFAQSLETVTYFLGCANKCQLLTMSKQLTDIYDYQQESPNDPYNSFYGNDN